MRFRAWGVTDKGYYRSNNEDAYFLSHAEGDLNSFPFFIVADGLGGHAWGEVASRLAVEKAASVLSEQKPPTPEALRKSFEEAHLNILRAKKENPEFGEMGTTMTALSFAGDLAFVGNCGDSRAYLFREGELRQITRDHSYVQELVDSGLITKKEARYHPYRNVVTGVLGLEGSFRTDIFSLEVKEGDVFLLATDGLTEELSDELFQKIVSSNPPETLLYELLSQALDHGGQDNITLIVVHLLT
ncbi:MAG: Stp1/IreP family PP2C-type Ser/Thr phosphatase [Caldiserica bacterium]|jgi:protein phosphatase|nr:Stp1/IreP family PP2C-type Ser/Thr phosphatase [Caldisericota bacterium]